MPPWPASSIRDSTAAIVDGLGYRRDVARSLFDRLLGWILAKLKQLVDVLPDVNLGPTLLLGLVVLLLALLVVRAVMNARAEREFRAGGRATISSGRRLDPWTEAERLAASGQYLEAAHHLCAALLAASSRRGEVTLHPSKTTGDYAREMRHRGAPCEAAFQGFRTRYDRVVYDQQQCTAEDFAALREAAEPLLTLERAA